MQFFLYKSTIIFPESTNKKTKEEVFFHFMNLAADIITGFFFLLANGQRYSLFIPRLIFSIKFIFKIGITPNKIVTSTLRYDNAGNNTFESVNKSSENFSHISINFHYTFFCHSSYYSAFLFI